MKNFFLFILPILLAFNFSNNQSLEQFGQNIFELIKSNKEDEILNLFISKNDFIETIDSSEMNKELADEIKNQFVLKFKNDSLKSIMKIRDGFMQIKEIMRKQYCGENVKIDSVITNVGRLRNLPLNIGKISIVYHCETDSQKIIVSVIQTIKGWKILDEFKLEYKESNYE